jgi:pilus assembly protein CpaF
MTLPVDADPVDPRSLPLFESRARQTPAGPEMLPGPRRPGRVRSGFTLHVLEADTSTPPPQSGPGAAASIDWGLVAAFRSQASEQLTKALADDRNRMERAAQEALGRAIILDLLEAAAAEAVTGGSPSSTLAEQDVLATAVFNALFRMGRLQPLVEDDRIENIVITGFARVWLELQDGTVIPGPPVADSDEELIDFLVFLASRSEVNARPFSQAQPRLHLRLDDGSRLAATAWVNPRPSVVIRRHRLTRVSLNDLVARGSLTPVAASFLTAAVRARLSLVVSGAQGFGKTTMARALCGAFDPMEAIATFETEYELGLHEMPDRHAIVHAWEARIGSGERGPDGKMAGEFSIAEALYDSFRFNVSRQIVGEIRGAEVWPMIKAMESGSGSISTTHAGDAEAAMRKLITCAMESGPQVTYELAARKLADTIDLIVQLDMDTDRARDGTRRRRRWVSQIVAITPGEKEKGYAATTIFASRNTRVAVAHTLPDELRKLERHGFDLAGFLTEARQYGAGS